MKWAHWEQDGAGSYLTSNNSVLSIKDCCLYRFHSSSDIVLTIFYVEKQAMAWKEYYADTSEKKILGKHG